MFCGHCGKQNSDNAKRCSNCGKQFDKTQFTRENTERIRLNNTQRIQKQNLTEKIVPAVPASPKPKTSLIAIIAGAVVLFCLVLLVAIFHFKPWLGRQEQNGLVKLEPASSFDASSYEDKEPPKQQIITTSDWAIYNGNWSAGGYTFSLELDGDEMKCTMRKDDEVWKSYGEIHIGEERVTIEFDEKEVELVALSGRKLRIIMDGKQYDAIPTNILPPDSEKNTNTYITNDNAYLFYSSSSGTRTTNDIFEIKNNSQQFWPLDKFAISTDDLDRLTQKEIEIIKNEAFARHGYIFINENWSEFFKQFDWYKPDETFTESEFTKLERQNVDTIILYEREKGWIS